MKMNIDPNNIKIKIKLLSSATILAQATVILFDTWEEHAWKILKSNKLHDIFQDHVWIQSPSFNAYGKWKELVFINDLDLYNLVQEKIYRAYKYAKDKEASLNPNHNNNEVTEKDYEAINNM